MYGRSNDSSKKPYLVGNDYKVYCDLTGVACASSDTRMTWNGFRVKNEYWYARNPLDFPAVVSPITSVPDPRPLLQTFEEFAYPFLEFETSSITNRVFLEYEDNSGFMELE